MNPFDFRGPEFLLYYAVLGVVVVAIVWYRRRARGSSGLSSEKLADPYEIACLRGGPKEAVRVATCALLDRGLLRAEETTIVAVRPDAAHLVGKPIERALMKECSKTREVTEVMSAPPVAAAASELEEKLIRRGLLAAPEGRIAALVGMVLMAAVALIKIVIAFGRGRYNVLYLVVFAGVFLVVLWWIAEWRQTLRGLRTLGDFRTLFGGSRAKAYTVGRHAPDLALLTAVFGLAAAWNHTRSGEFRKLFPSSANEKGKVTSYGTNCSTTWSSCGSSFGGSSCSSSGGSSCGGGGCGGGCGGCGGS